MSLCAAVTPAILLLHSSKIPEFSVGGLAGFTTVNLNVNRGALLGTGPVNKSNVKRCQKLNEVEKSVRIYHEMQLEMKKDQR